MLKYNIIRLMCLAKCFYGMRFEVFLTGNADYLLEETPSPQVSSDGLLKKKTSIYFQTIYIAG
jgi:hypothetical protein